MENNKKILIATVKKCNFCNGDGYLNNEGWNTCKYCGGTGKLISAPLSIKELSKLLKLESYLKKSK